MCSFSFFFFNFIFCHKKQFPEFGNFDELVLILSFFYWNNFYSFFWSICIYRWEDENWKAVQFLIDSTAQHKKENERQKRCCRCRSKRKTRRCNIKCRLSHLEHKLWSVYYSYWIVGSSTSTSTSYMCTLDVILFLLTFFPSFVCFVCMHLLHSPHININIQK